MHRVHRLLVVLLQRWTRLRAWRSTGPAATRSALVIAPHPDDESLGCATSIARKAQRATEVWIVVVTDGAAGSSPLVADGTDLVELRQEEAVAAAAELGVDRAHLQFLGFPDGELSMHGAALERRLESLLTEFEPDEVYVPSLLDGHPDHAASAAAMRSLADGGRYRGTLYEFPIWYWEALPRFRLARSSGRAATFPLQLLRELVRPVERIRATRAERDRKRQALECHASQIDWTDRGRTTIPLSGALVSEFIEQDEVFFPFRRN